MTERKGGVFFFGGFTNVCIAWSMTVRSVESLHRYGESTQVRGEVVFQYYHWRSASTSHHSALSVSFRKWEISTKKQRCRLRSTILTGATGVWKEECVHEVAQMTRYFNGSRYVWAAVTRYPWFVQVAFFVAFFFIFLFYFFMLFMLLFFDQCIGTKSNMGGELCIRSNG